MDLNIRVRFEVLLQLFVKREHLSLLGPFGIVVDVGMKEEHPDMRLLARGALPILVQSLSGSHCFKLVSCLCDACRLIKEGCQALNVA